MIELNFPEPRFRTRMKEGQPQLFDPIRSIWVVIKPEEWVRQNFIQWLILEHQVPSEMIAVEREIRVGQMTKRFDLLIMNNKIQPWMLVELKSTSVEIDERVLMQVATYSSVVDAQYIAVSNGKVCHIAEKEKVENPWISTFPVYSLDSNQGNIPSSR